jgi:hypothetical protein
MYKFNYRFLVSKKNKFWQDSDVFFRGCTEKKKHKEEYRGVFGPCFVSLSSLFKNDKNGIKGAVRRVTSVRKPEVLGLHDHLVDNQVRNVHGRNFGIQFWLDTFRTNLSQLIPDIDSTVWRDLWANAPHDKRPLRRRAMKSLFYHSSQLDTRVDSIEYKCKTGEILPQDKYMRAIGDLTCPGSTVFGYFIDCVKATFALPFTYLGGTAQFIKSPDLEILRTVFSSMMKPLGPVFYYFSDDSVVSIPCVDGTLTANMDISSADGSNYWPVFWLLRCAMTIDPRFEVDLKAVFDQLGLPMYVHNPQDYSESIKFTPIGPVLYSGSVLTTITNNMANMLIFLAFMTRYRRDMTKQQAHEALVAAARDVGYIVTLEVCTSYHNIQFLKHSPCINTNSQVDAVLNLGVILRGFGSTTGDMIFHASPFLRKLLRFVPISWKARLFNSEVVRSRVHSGNHCIMDAFREKITFFRCPIKTDISHVVAGRQLGYIDAQELGTRYSLTIAEIDELAYLIRSAGIGDFVKSPILDRIYKVDYSY